MGGGLMQLVAYGAQDIYLTGNPQITFFKVVYRRHTNFSMEAIEQTFSGTPDFGRKVNCTISRNGDLIHRVYLQVELPELHCPKDSYARWVNWVGHALVKNVEVEIGGQRIDKHYGDWLHIWNELSQTAGKQAGYANMVGNVDKLFRPTPATADNVTKPSLLLFVPLQFWFCRNPGLALPLIALQYHEVKINLEFRDFSDLVGNGAVASTKSSLKSASLYVDYIYLDTDERRRFAQVSHEYLIEQLQFTGDESVNQSSVKVKLNFNHPVKELVWVVQLDKCVDTDTGAQIKGRQWFNYTNKVDETPYSHVDPNVMMNVHDGVINVATDGTGIDGTSSGTNGATFGIAGRKADDLKTIVDTKGAAGATVGADTSAAGLLSSLNKLYDVGKNPVKTAKLTLNGHDRFSERDGRYFNLVQPYQHHERVPCPGINVYSFGLKPEEHQPSGTCNMSRIDNATLVLNLDGISSNAGESGKVRVYATNYNVLRIMSGMGGLAYSN